VDISWPSSAIGWLTTPPDSGGQHRIALRDDRAVHGARENTPARWVRARLAPLCFVLTSALGLAACSTHRVAQTHPCPALTAQSKVVVASSRGAIGLAKVGLTPKGLKALDDCS